MIVMSYVIGNLKCRSKLWIKYKNKLFANPKEILRKKKKWFIKVKTFEPVLNSPPKKKKTMILYFCLDHFRWFQLNQIAIHRIQVIGMLGFVIDRTNDASHE